ncbi:hypothetical protein ASPVEDRAFT_77504 [Aspergillus versicolor CBS 583.65]|uniref:FAD dependent oxidoreductase domain-containing protein n=1 Tax=Aspergillus versicolor CBS 583.65 TaxID=1036611 RepID=A0A1L9Q5C4_ASPVE|nr:uncharacterized protein ASPVEDRAFT_77504 [Aspergillus versicolor CBS 583.65]OJJ08939.1 hypothetical protein ASPVEDRAFT_77504 [Aspergillus versicolor CBS 583.65]
MAQITIVGAGIVGMATASMLSRHHKVTIVARNLPGDKPSIEWASPWAGVSFIAGGCSSPVEAKMQLDAFAELWRWSDAHPESSIKKIPIEDFHDDKTEDDIWWKDYMPDVSSEALYFRFLPPESLPNGAKLGTAYTSLILNPDIFLLWLRQRLESTGVQFKRMTLNSLSEAHSLGHDVLINATGFGSLTLNDVRDQNVELIRGQTMLVKSDYDKLFMRDTGDTYTYVIPRLDGTAVLGGTRHKGSVDPNPDWDLCQDIVNRINKNLPNHFSNNLQDYQIVRHNVGIRPSRVNGVRVEREIKDGQVIVHAYGVAGGGYIFSFGIARAARDLVEGYLFPHHPAKL